VRFNLMFMFRSKKIREEKGFTLIELLIAMTIFVLFTGVLMNSYAGIVRAQHEANQYREFYSEARGIFETITQELREGMVDYQFPIDPDSGVSSGEEIRIVSKDASGAVRFFLDDDFLQMERGTFDVEFNYLPSNSEALHSNIKVKNLHFYISPAIDPYNQKFVDYHRNQFHPLVTIYAEFETDDEALRHYELSLQTSISSRIYNQIYQKIDYAALDAAAEAEAAAAIGG
jgi:prepilin-type N-terminal cleavage/methylation domain-containing protein